MVTETYKPSSWEVEVIGLLQVQKLVWTTQQVLDYTARATQPSKTLA